MKKKLKKGFTLVELVIVIAVIAILSAVLIPTFGNVISNANEAAAKSEVSNAITQYTSNQASNGGSLFDGYFVLFKKAQTVSGDKASEAYTADNIDSVFSFIGGKLEKVSFTLATIPVEENKLQLNVKGEDESVGKDIKLKINGLTEVKEDSWKTDGTAVLDGVVKNTVTTGNAVYVLSGRIVLLQVVTA